MTTLYSILVAIDVLLAIGIIGLILIQHGKGADVGAAFGSGASGTVFGSQGSASFLTRLTAILATLFFINSLALAYLASNRPVAESVIDAVEQTEVNSSTTDVPKSDAILDNEASDVPSTDDLSDAVMNEVHDSMESIKEEASSALDNASPDDVPE